MNRFRRGDRVRVARGGCYGCEVGDVCLVEVVEQVDGDDPRVGVRNLTQPWRNLWWPKQSELEPTDA